MHISLAKKERLIREIFKPWRKGIKKHFPTYYSDGVLFKSKYHGMSSKTLFREFKDSPSLEEIQPNDFWFVDHYSSIPTKKQLRIQKIRSEKWAVQRVKRLKAIKRVLREQRREKRELKEKLREKADEKQTKKTGRSKSKIA